CFNKNEERKERKKEQSKPTPYRAVEEIGCPQHVQMHTDELPPRHGLLALRSWWDAVTFQDVAHRLIAERIAQLGQCTHDTVIPPQTFFSAMAVHKAPLLFA